MVSRASQRKVSSVVRNCYDGLMRFVDSNEDTDRLLSYYTRQQVMFLDRKLGCTFILITLCIAAYIVGYMFVYEKGYLEVEQAKGAVVTHVLVTPSLSAAKRLLRDISARMKLLILALKTATFS